MLHTLVLPDSIVVSADALRPAFGTGGGPVLQLAAARLAS